MIGRGLRGRTPAVLAGLVVAHGLGPSPAPAAGTAGPAAGTAGPAGGTAGPAGGPVPAGTRATSVTFISPRTGFVLGTAPCARPPCTVILRTRNRGASWVGLPAPRERIGWVDSRALWGLRFADARRGLAFGTDLWETADGGASWRRDPPAGLPGAPIITLEPVRDRGLVAIAGACAGGSLTCPGPVRLVRRALRGGAWTTIATVGTQTVGGTSLAVRGATVWALVGGRIETSRDGGIHFAAVASPCNPHVGLGYAPASITAAGSAVDLLCVGSPGAGQAPKVVFARSGGRWIRRGRPSSGGGGGEIAAGSSRVVMVASSSGASWLYRSADGGLHWGAGGLTEDDGGLGWNDLGFTTPQDAVVVHGPAALAGRGEPTGGQVLLSGDGGRTWRVSRF